MQTVADLKPRQRIQRLQIIPLDWTTASALHVKNANHPSFHKVTTKNARKSTAERCEMHVKICLFDQFSHSSMSVIPNITGQQVNKLRHTHKHIFSLPACGT